MQSNSADQAILAELRRKIETTSKIRFVSYGRLVQHEKYSQWSLSLFSLILIASGLLSLLESPGDSATYFDAAQVLLAVAVLILSLLIGQERFGVEADNMHRCGIELMALSRSDAVSSGSADQVASQHRRLLSEYRGILEKYGNQTPSDYLAYKITQPSDYYKDRPLQYRLDSCRVMARKIGRFTVYFLPPIILAIAVWYISI